MIRGWIGLVENLVNFSDHQKEPTNMTPDVMVGDYIIHAVAKSPSRMLDYMVWIEGPERDPEEHIDIRRYAGQEPEKMTGLPKYDPKSVDQFSKFAKRVNTLADYGQDKPPEVRFNPAWVMWRKTAILRMAKQYGLV